MIRSPITWVRVVECGTTLETTDFSSPITTSGQNSSMSRLWAQVVAGSILLMGSTLWVSMLVSTGASLSREIEHSSPFLLSFVISVLHCDTPVRYRVKPSTKAALATLA